MIPLIEQNKRGGTVAPFSPPNETLIDIGPHLVIVVIG
jgi:hypothetical protein